MDTLALLVVLIPCSNGLNPREGIITKKHTDNQGDQDVFKWLKSSGGDYYLDQSC